MTDDKKSVWLFHGDEGRFSSAVFSTEKFAHDWIQTNKLSGVLTEYPLDQSVYDWAIENNKFEIRRDRHESAQFKQTFTSAYQQHFHYVDGQR